MRKLKRDLWGISLLLIVTGLIAGQTALANGVGWLDPWSNRRPIAINSPCGALITDYQVQIILDNTFDFSKALPDGSDIRVTGDDGLTLIPFWVESWDPSGTQGSIWVKMPSIPTTGTMVYLYYGNPYPPGPMLVETPPVGPWQEMPNNPIRPIGDPGNGESLLGENLVYDDVTNHYWMVFAMYRGGSNVGLAWSDTPADPTSWHWHGQVIAQANAPHIIKHDDLWYIIYSDWSHGWGPPTPSICADTATNIGGPYYRADTLLTVSEPWEAARVDEPFVFQRTDGKWILMYMGDAGGTTEQVGYAIADDLTGPYTKFAGNPCIAFGTPGSFDAGTVADAWVVEMNGVFYIGYTVSPTKSSPWRTAMAITTDWLTFTKLGIIRDLGGPGEWDQYDAFRGAVTRIGDTYYFPYTGKQSSNYLMGIVTQPVYMPKSINDPDDVFLFIDLFDNDLSKWVISYSGAGGSAQVSGGILTLTGVTVSYVQARANKEIGLGTLMEIRAAHPDAGLNPGGAEGNTAAELGYKPSDFSWNNVARIMDWPDLSKYCIQATAGGANSGYIPTAVNFDTDWHDYGIHRTTDSYVRFLVDANPFESIGPAYAPTIGLYPWLMSYSRNAAPQSRFDIDWVRVRNWCGADAGIVLGDEERPLGAVSGKVTAGGKGLLGVTIDLAESGGGVYASIKTDATGNYKFDDVPNGDYVACVIVPLGFAPVTEAYVPVTVAGGEAIVDFELGVAATGQVRHIWWWKTQIQNITDGLRSEITMADLNRYGQAIYDHFYLRNDNYAILIENVTFASGPRPLNFDDFVEIFLGVYDPSLAARVRDALVTNLLNIASGRQSQLGVVSADGATASQAITYFSGRYLVGGYNNYYTAYINLRKMHMAQMISAGVIPPSTPNVMFRPENGIELLPAVFSLSQNYPNPFNPATEIQFSLPTPATVSLDIYNITGEKVATPAEGYYSAGTHTVRWNGNDLNGHAVASGIYFYRLKAGDMTATRKMLLVK